MVRAGWGTEGSANKPPKGQTVRGVLCRGYPSLRLSGQEAATHKATEGRTPGNIRTSKEPAGRRRYEERPPAERKGLGARRPEEISTFPHFPRFPHPKIFAV